MSFIQGALIQKLTQEVKELTQRVVMLEGGKSLSKTTSKANTLKATGETEEATNGAGKGSAKEPLEVV